MNRVPQVRVLIVEDVAVHRHALADILAAQPSIAGVESVAGAGAALDRLAAWSGNWVVLLNGATGGGHPTLAAIRGAAPAVPVVMLAVAGRDVMAYAEAGVAGWLPREASADDLVALIHSVARGETRCSPAEAAALLRRVAGLAVERSTTGALHRLTAREQQVLRLVDEGLSNLQIAHQLSIDIRTVKNHVHSILEKFRVHRRAEAAGLYRAALRTTSHAGGAP